MSRRQEGTAAGPWWQAEGSQARVAASDSTGAEAATPVDPRAAPATRGDSDSVRVVSPAAPTAGARANRHHGAARPIAVDSVAVDSVVTAPVAVDSPAADSVVTAVVDTGLSGIALIAPGAAPEVVARRRQLHDQRRRQDRERVHRVNEFTLWCLEQELWDEARIHLERALQRDSLAASLHNNLGIVYERLGHPQLARARYRLAAELAPDRDLYGANLQRLQRALEHVPVETDSLVNDPALLPPQRGRYRPRQEGDPGRAEGAPQP